MPLIVWEYRRVLGDLNLNQLVTFIQRRDTSHRNSHTRHRRHLKCLDPAAGANLRSPGRPGAGWLRPLTLGRRRRTLTPRAVPFAGCPPSSLAVPGRPSRGCRRGAGDRSDLCAHQRCKGYGVRERCVIGANVLHATESKAMRSRRAEAGEDEALRWGSSLHTERAVHSGEAYASAAGLAAMEAAGW